MKSTHTHQNDAYAIFCASRRFKQTARGLRYAYTQMQASLASGDGKATTWYLICFDCAQAAGLRS